MLIHIGVTHLNGNLGVFGRAMPDQTPPLPPNSVSPIIFRKIAVDFLPELSYKYNSSRPGHQSFFATLIRIGLTQLVGLMGCFDGQPQFPLELRNP